ncbi:DNA-binding transcriptional regulator, AcrR family [Salinihabitans flavidus]|uniref:DNA-binding transcriptional regulator, AcrR family n=1 Tax=Salinihabitans flavidus TaxID=569882 RepID=A0A1H8PLV4_9RHOB|nr:TetR/AcrR family transcriptional regulator [Salinihabitans flavidus]SEO42698.1 DNA-binding transcriptional regulator, AcrR family [Salinihabitans flavidus]
MATKRRVSRLSPERRRADIMTAAREVFSEKGFNEAVMSEIAERAGVVEGSIYRYFKNKRDLLFCVSESWFEEMISTDEPTLAAVTGTWNRLRFIIHRHLMAIKTHPDLSRLVFQHLRPDPEYRKTKLFALNKAYTNRVVELVREGVENGEIRPDVSPSLVRDMIFGAIEHRTWAYLRNEGGYDPDTLADQLTDLVSFGLRKKDQTDEIARAVEMLEGAIARLQPAAGAS